MLRYILSHLVGTLGALLMITSFYLGILMIPAARITRRRSLWVASPLLVLMGVGLFFGRSYLASIGIQGVSF